MMAVIQQATVDFQRLRKQFDLSPAQFKKMLTDSVENIEADICGFEIACAGFGEMQTVTYLFDISRISQKIGATDIGAVSTDLQKFICESPQGQGPLGYDIRLYTLLSLLKKTVYNYRQLIETLM